MARIDTNIFKDLSTAKGNIPTEESLNYDSSFNSLKIIRLKSSSDWLGYVCMEVEVPQFQKN